MLGSFEPKCAGSSYCPRPDLNIIGRRAVEPANSFLFHGPPRMSRDIIVASAGKLHHHFPHFLYITRFFLSPDVVPVLSRYRQINWPTMFFVTAPVVKNLIPSLQSCTFLGSGDSLALVSPPPMCSRHRILEPYGRWHATIYICFACFSWPNQGDHCNYVAMSWLPHIKTIKPNHDTM